METFPAAQDIARELEGCADRVDQIGEPQSIFRAAQASIASRGKIVFPFRATMKGKFGICGKIDLHSSCSRLSQSAFRDPDFSSEIVVIISGHLSSPLPWTGSRFHRFRHATDANIWRI
jgi:hypothetical protein